MTRERAEELVSDLLDACVDYEHAPSAQVEKIRRDFHQKREVMIDMLSMSDPAVLEALKAVLQLVATDARYDGSVVCMSARAFLPNERSEP